MNLKAKEGSRGVLNRGMYMYTFIKVIIVLFGRRIEKMLYLMGKKKKRRISNMLRKKIIKDNLNQRIRYRIPKHKAIDQLANVIVFDLEICNDQ